MSARFLFAAVLTLAFSAGAQNAQDELERQLKEMVGKPPTKLLIEYEGLDQPNYKLEEISFELDGSSLPTPALEKLNGEGKHLIFHGDIKPGKHTLETTVVLTDVAGVLFSYEAGYKWKVKNTRSFEQAPGLEVQVLVLPEMNPSEKDAKKKFVLKSTAAPKMLAKLEDGTMPDVPKPNLQVPKEQPPDAGAPVVAEVSAAEKAKILKEQQAEDARAKKQAAMEAAARKKEEAAAAKAAAAEEKKRKAQEAAELRAAAADERKRRAQDAAEAKKAAAEEKKRQREEALAAAKAAKEPKQPAEPKQPTEVAAADTGKKSPVQPTEPSIGTPPEPAADAVDAGPAIAAAEPPKAPQQPSTKPPAEPESSGFPLPIIIGGVVALLGIIIFIATRKKEQPPY